MYTHREENTSDKALVDRLKSGDEHAYYVLFDRYWEQLYVLAKSLLNDSELSKDIVQDVWLSLWERRKEILNTNIRAYLIQAVKFKVYKEWRDGKLTDEHEAYLESIPASDSIEEMLHKEELQQHIQAWVEELPDKCGEVFRLSRFEHLSNQEIAERLNLSQRTVETHISNALKFLRKKMKILILLLPGFLS